MSVVVNTRVQPVDHSDTESVDSYEDLRIHRPSTPKPRFQVNGEVPKVLYVVDYFTSSHRFLESHQSAAPFKELPKFDRRSPMADDEDDCLEKPVLEIVTKVYESPLRPGIRPPRHHHRAASPVQERPITCAFNDQDYRSEEYYGDEEQSQTLSGPEVTQPHMLIHSEHLINALKAVVSYYPFFNLTGKTININAPYRVLYHHRKDLERYAHNQPATHSSEYAATTAEHIGVLLDFLDESFGKDIAQEEQRHCSSPTPMATFEYFWLLLKPGEIMYAKRYDIWTPYVISSVSTGQQQYPNSTESYSVNCWFLESNGIKVDRFMETFTIAPWIGEQAITSLSVIPEAFWAEDLEAQGGRPMREKQIEEGKLYWELLKRPTYMEYDGLLVNSCTGNKLADGPTGFMNGRVVCDASGFDKYGGMASDWNDGPRGPRYRRASPYVPSKDHIPQNRSRCGCEACSADGQRGREAGPFMGLENLDPLVDTPPESDLFYHVLCKTIPGFILGNRKWGHLSLANLKPVKTDKEAFKYLVLDDEIKLTVKALIGKFAAGQDGKISPWANDFVKNKGEGRIFLLHGTPGVGKTCTAECIAELTNRPLIALTSGDLSVDSWRVERNLSYFLELGQRYGALVLLDEADVYLERRRSKDIDRNGLVSVFLRALEYYRGVLFLTTNRVQSFDGAFLSRIHVALHYKNLRDEDRERIWRNNFDRMDRDSSGRVHVAVAAREYVWQSREVRALRWNGREIRNAMQTALALAESDAQDDNLDTIMIAEKHLRAVVKMSKGFKDYIKRTTLGLTGYAEDDLDDEDATDEEDIVQDD